MAAAGAARPGWRGWLRRLGWLAALWLGGVLLMAAAAGLLRLLMRALGLVG